VWVTSSLTATLTPTRIALGNFDGVHLGHQQVIGRILGRADTASCLESAARVVTPYLSAEMTHRYVSTDRDRDRPAPAPTWREAAEPPGRVYTTVLTFNPHPQAFFSGESRSLLSPIAEKVDALRALGVDQLVLLPFDRALAALSPEEFFRQILLDGLQARAVSVGGNFRFGKRRSGTAADLRELCQTHGIEAHIVDLHHIDADRVSSSAVRAALEAGDLKRATRLLGRPYRIAGSVERGRELGRTIGFPTANIHVPPDKFLPRWGVYAGRVWLGENEPPVASAINIGHRPTVNGQRPTVEAHLIDWRGDLYGRCLSVELLHFLRPEQKFDSLADLKAQIGRDRDRAIALLADSPVTPDPEPSE